MFDIRWKALERLIRMSQVSAQGDAVFLAFFRVVKTLQNPTWGRKLTGLPDELSKKAFASGTIDVLMMRIPTYRASGSDREEFERCEGR